MNKCKVCLFVCLSVCVGHNLELWWNGWTDWVAVWGVDLDEPVKPCGVVWFISQHQLCLPKVAHLALAFAAWLRSSESVFRLLTHFAFGNRLIPNASSCLLRIKLHKVPAVLRETWQGAWIPRGKGQFWGCPSGVLLKMEVGIRKGAWRRAWRYPAYLWSLRWVYAVKKTWRLVYGVYPHIPPNTPLVTPSDAAVRQNSITT